MAADVEYSPGHDQRERGFSAIRKEYGGDMVQRIQNWPRIAERVMLAQNLPENDPGFIREIDEVKRNVERARADKDYALAQASVIARNVPKSDWTAVPSVAQLKRELDDSDRIRSEVYATHKAGLK